MLRLAVGLAALNLTDASPFDGLYGGVLLAASGTAVVLAIVGRTLPARPLTVGTADAGPASPTT